MFPRLWNNGSTASEKKSNATAANVLSKSLRKANLGKALHRTTRKLRVDDRLRKRYNHTAVGGLRTVRQCASLTASSFDFTPSSVALSRVCHRSSTRQELRKFRTIGLYSASKPP